MLSYQLFIVTVVTLIFLPSPLLAKKAIPTPLAELSEMPDPKFFWKNFVEPWTPVIIRGAAQGTDAMKWAGDEKEGTEAKLRKKFGHVRVRIERQYEERTKEYNVEKDLNPFHSITIDQFFDKTNKGADGYVISVVPDEMAKDIAVPRCILCGDRKYSHWASPRRWMTAIEETGLWISTEGSTYSQLHFDQPNIINCMVAGPSKTWLFVNTKKYHKQVHLERDYFTGDAESGEQWHPTTSNHSPHRLTDKILEHIPHSKTIQYPGDCIYLPHGYLHSVKKDRKEKGDRAVSVAYSIMWNHAEQFSESACLQHYPVTKDSPQLPLSLFDQHWWFSGQGLVPLGYALPYSIKEDLIFRGQHQREFSTSSKLGQVVYQHHKINFKNFLKAMKSFSDDMQIVPGHEIFETAVNFFQLADCDGNGYLDSMEITWIPRSAYLTLAAALDFASTWPDPYIPQSREQIVQNAIELEKHDGIKYVEPASETHWMCQRRNIYGISKYGSFDDSTKTNTTTGTCTTSTTTSTNLNSNINSKYGGYSNKDYDQLHVTSKKGHMMSVFNLPNFGGDVDEIDVNDMSNMPSVDEIKSKYFPPIDLKPTKIPFNENECYLAEKKYCSHCSNNKKCLEFCYVEHKQPLREVCTDRYDQNVGRPLILRGMAKSMPAYENWKTDEVLKKNYPNSLIEVEAGNKQETRVHQQKKMYLDEFVDTYRNSSVYAVANLPMAMAKDVHLPQWVEDGGFTNHLQASIMWWSSGNTKSVIHNDDLHNINCLFSGRKRFAFWSLKDRPSIETSECGWIDTTNYDRGTKKNEFGYGSYGGHMNVSSMDLENYPCWEKLEWFDAMMEEGDCVLIPSKWYHHVHSLPGRNVAVNLWFGSETRDKNNPSSKNKKINSKNRKPLTPADCSWSEWPEGVKNAPQLHRAQFPCDLSGKFANQRVKHFYNHFKHRPSLKMDGFEEEEEEEELKIDPEKWNTNHFKEPKDNDFLKSSSGSLPPVVNIEDSNVSKEVRNSLYNGIPIVIRNATKGMKMNGWDCVTISDMTNAARKSQKKNHPIDYETPQVHYAKGMGSENIDMFKDPDWMFRDKSIRKSVNDVEILRDEPIGPTVTPGYWSLKTESSHSLIRKIQSNIEIPSFMKDWTESSSIESDFLNTPEMWFGMKRAGAQPHQDSHCTSTISFQLSGHKRWRTGPALEIRNAAGVHGSYDGYIDPKKWKPQFEVILNPGDAIIIPTSFIHETKNVGGSDNTDERKTCSLSITHQFSSPPPSRYIREYLPRLMLSPALASCSSSTYYNYGNMGWKYVSGTNEQEIFFSTEKQLISKLLKTIIAFDRIKRDGALNMQEFYLFLQRHSIIGDKIGQKPSDDFTGHARGIFKYFDVNNNKLLEKDEILNQFGRWLSNKIFSSNIKDKMESIRLKRKVYKCNTCGEGDQSDICDGPIRQFEERARARYASMISNGYPSVETVKQQTVNDAINSGLSMNCKNIMIEYSNFIHLAQVPSKKSFNNSGDHPAMTDSHVLARFIDVDQEGGNKYGNGEEEEDEEEEPGERYGEEGDDEGYDREEDEVDDEGGEEGREEGREEGDDEGDEEGNEEGDEEEESLGKESQYYNGKNNEYDGAEEDEEYDEDEEIEPPIKRPPIKRNKKHDRRYDGEDDGNDDDDETAEGRDTIISNFKRLEEL